MHSFTNFLLWVLAVVVVLLAVGWFGFQVPAESYPPHVEPTGELARLDHLANLPEPLYQLFEESLGKNAPDIKTAVVWGKAKVKIDRKSTRLNSSHSLTSRMPSSA